MKITAEQYHGAHFVAFRRGDHYIVLKNRFGRVGRVGSLASVLVMVAPLDPAKVIVSHDDTT